MDEGEITWKSDLDCDWSCLGLSDRPSHRLHLIGVIYFDSLTAEEATGIAQNLEGIISHLFMVSQREGHTSGVCDLFLSAVLQMVVANSHFFFFFFYTCFLQSSLHISHTFLGLFS